MEVNLTVGFSKFSAFPCGETIYVGCEKFWRLKTGKDSYYHAKYGGASTSREFL